MTPLHYMLSGLSIQFNIITKNVTSNQRIFEIIPESLLLSFEQNDTLNIFLNKSFLIVNNFYASVYNRVLGLETPIKAVHEDL